MYTHSARTMLRYIRTVVMHFSFSKNIGFFGRLEEDELVSCGDLPFQRFVAKCASRVRVCDQRKHSTETSSMIPELSIVETLAERNGEQCICACKLPPIFVVVDQFSTGTSIGYYLGRKFKYRIWSNSNRFLNRYG